MGLHQDREPQNAQFLEAQRLLRELLRTVGVELPKTGTVTMHIGDGFLRQVDAAPVPVKVRIERVRDLRPPLSPRKAVDNRWMT